MMNKFHTGALMRLLVAIGLAATIAACDRGSAPTTPSAASAASSTSSSGTRTDDNHRSNPGPGGGDADDNDDERNGAVELNGTIAAGSLAGACASNSLSFRIGSTLVRTNTSTQFEDTSCESLTAGDSVEVKGARQADAAVLASRVEKRR